MVKKCEEAQFSHIFNVSEFGVWTPLTYKFRQTVAFPGTPQISRLCVTHHLSTDS